MVRVLRKSVPGWQIYTHIWGVEDIFLVNFRYLLKSIKLDFYLRKIASAYFEKKCPQRLRFCEIDVTRVGLLEKVFSAPGDLMCARSGSERIVRSISYCFQSLQQE